MKWFEFIFVWTIKEIQKFWFPWNSPCGKVYRSIVVWRYQFADEGFLRYTYARQWSWRFSQSRCFHGSGAQHRRTEANAPFYCTSLGNNRHNKWKSSNVWSLEAIQRNKPICRWYWICERNIGFTYPDTLDGCFIINYLTQLSQLWYHNCHKVCRNKGLKAELCIIQNN